MTRKNMIGENDFFTRVTILKKKHDYQRNDFHKTT